VMIKAAPTFTRRYFEEDHVLPFGYWIDRQEWVPVVHVHEEFPDSKRPDPFNPDPDADRAEGQTYFTYSAGCNYCHTTFPLGDMLIRNPRVLGKHTPADMYLSMADYLKAAHPSMVSGMTDASHVQQSDLMNLMVDFGYLEGPDHAVTLGVSCEACHLGGRAHAEQKTKRPDFVPHSPYLFLSSHADKAVPAEEQHREYINWACGRCHAGQRPKYANGISTWNSTEFSDASRGACYSKLTCVTCHNPHQKIGARWTRTADQDDAVCLKCHQQYENATQRAAHTHHAAGSEGDRCMNCHMPRIDEGLQDVVRTHTIFSPTDREMIEANQLNACNLCHLDKPVDWTTEHLADWYGASFDETRLAESYPNRHDPVGTGWLANDFESVRLVAADALTRRDCRWALPQIVAMLDDPYLLNRQFTQQGLEQMLQVSLADFGYRFYMTADERRDPIRKIRDTFTAPIGPPAP